MSLQVGDKVVVSQGAVRGRSVATVLRVGGCDHHGCRFGDDCVEIRDATDHTVCYHQRNLSLVIEEVRP